MDRDRRISRAGNPRARTTMMQLAWLWLRYQPGSELAEWFRERVGPLAGRTRRIAIVAMARKLLIALWRYAETGVIPAGAEIRAEIAEITVSAETARNCHRQHSPAAIRGTRPSSSLVAHRRRVSGGSRLAGATPRA